MRIYITILLLLAKVLALGPSLADHHHHYNLSSATALAHNHHHDNQKQKFEEDILGFLFANFDHGQGVDSYIGTGNNSNLLIKKADALSMVMPSESSVIKQFRKSTAKYPEGEKRPFDHHHRYQDQLRGPPAIS